MADDKTKPVQVAEAGFGEAVEAKGFKQVGRTHWRLDGDGIVHHVRLNRGYTNIPGSFRDAFGYYYPEFRVLADKCNHRNLLDKLPGTSILFQGAAADAFVTQDRKRQFGDWEVRYGSPGGRPGFMKLLKDAITPPPDFDSEFYKKPLGYRKRLEGRGRFDAEAWILKDMSAEELAQSLAECWERGQWHYHGRHTSFQSLYEEDLRPLIEARTEFLEHYLLYAFMGGDHHLIQRMADLHVPKLEPSLEELQDEVYRRCIRQPNRVDWAVERGVRHPRCCRANPDASSHPLDRPFPNPECAASS